MLGQELEKDWELIEACLKGVEGNYLVRGWGNLVKRMGNHGVLVDEQFL